MLPLKDLLGSAIKRARISTQVSATRVVGVAQDTLRDILGPQESDARVVSYQAGTLTIETRHSSASQFIRESEPLLLSALKRQFPEEQVKTVRYRVVGRFRGSEVDSN